MHAQFLIQLPSRDLLQRLDRLPRNRATRVFPTAPDIHPHEMTAKNTLQSHCKYRSLIHHEQLSPDVASNIEMKTLDRHRDGMAKSQVVLHNLFDAFTSICGVNIHTEYRASEGVESLYLK